MPGLPASLLRWALLSPPQPVLELDLQVARHHLLQELGPSTPLSHDTAVKSVGSLVFTYDAKPMCVCVIM